MTTCKQRLYVIEIEYVGDRLVEDPKVVQVTSDIPLRHLDNSPCSKGYLGTDDLDQDYYVAGFCDNIGGLADLVHPYLGCNLDKLDCSKETGTVNYYLTPARAFNTPKLSPSEAYKLAVEDPDNITLDILAAVGDSFNHSYKYLKNSLGPMTMAILASAAAYNPED